MPGGGAGGQPDRVRLETIIMTDAYASAALKTATMLLVRDVGGLDAAALCTRVKRSVIADYTNRHSPLHMPADVVADLEAVASVPYVTQTLARLRGARLQQVAADGAATLAGHSAQMMREVSEYLGTLLAAQQDGVVDAAEADALLRQIQAVQREAEAVAAATSAHLRAAAARAEALHAN